MPSIERAADLADLQRGFARALMWADDEVPPAFTGASARAPVKRFGVYRNNVFASLTQTLRARFPVVERLVGEEFFAAMARVFLTQHPPRSPALFEYGAAFAGFLEGFEPVAEVPHLPDIARLEWLRNVAYHAADHVPLDGAVLGSIAPEDLPAVTLKLHPSAGLLSSPYPVISIWETNTHDAEVRSICTQTPSEDALVVRPALDVVVVRLGPGGHAFADALASSTPLAAAADVASAAAADFSLSHALGSLIAAGAFASFAVAPAH